MNENAKFAQIKSSNNTRNAGNEHKIKIFKPDILSTVRKFYFNISLHYPTFLLFHRKCMCLLFLSQFSCLLIHVRLNYSTADAAAAATSSTNIYILSAHCSTPVLCFHVLYLFVCVFRALIY